MGAKLKNIEVDITNRSPLDDIDTKLIRGIQVALEEINIHDNGLLSYKKRQVLLYIQDHGWNVAKALIDGSQGKKYHVAYCKTLEQMNAGGRYNRYVIKHDISGTFYIDGINSTTKEHESGDAKLQVCKNCLRHLNYQEYDKVYYEKKQIFENFSLNTFFETYQQHFLHKPKYQAGEKKSVYSNDWEQQSQSYRNAVQWQCEKCQVNLLHHKYLLHTHHINGVKGDNNRANLIALCIECHANEPNHEHMRLKESQKEQLMVLRTA
jgi:hypothetical protein